MKRIVIKSMVMLALMMGGSVVSSTVMAQTQEQAQVEETQKCPFFGVFRQIKKQLLFATA